LTEARLNEINQSLINDGLKCFVEDISPRYTFTDGSGKVNRYDNMKDWPKSRKVVSWPTRNVMIHQSGNLAVATGEATQVIEVVSTKVRDT
jgi:hypothetical protein